MTRRLRRRQAAETGFFGRLRDSLGKSRRALTEQLAVAAFDPADDEAWERLGGGADRSRCRRARHRGARRRLEARGVVGDLDGGPRRGGRGHARRAADAGVGERPSVVLVVGVNGTGKTTTIGKLA